MKDWFFIATIQFTPAFNRVEYNLQKILNLCQEAVFKQAKLLVLPEMCLSGYCFKNPAQVLAIAEAADGPSCVAFQNFCLQNHCWVSYGFAESDAGSLYNSQNLINPQGELVQTYRKVCLFTADQLWAKPGKQFCSLHTEYGKLGMGICMDLNSDHFLQFHHQQQVDLLLFSANWVFQGTSAIDYWLKRLANFNGTVCIANRAGTEGMLQFCGSSCVVQNHRLIAHADSQTDTVLITKHGLMAKAS